MATIVEMINPLTGLPEQVDKLDHTAQEIDDAVDLTPQLSSPNLLDNWYFGNPVNQRGISSGTGPANAYGIDRWKFLNSGTLTIGSDYIAIASDTHPYALQQYIEPGRFAGVIGMTATLSALVKGNGRLKISLGSSNAGAYSNYFSYSDWTLVQMQGTIVSGTDYHIYVQTRQGSGNCYVKAVKLELGSQQTLAHQDADGNWVLNEIPDYGEQLTRCQRYYQVIPANVMLSGIVTASNTVLSVTAFLSQTMRTTPTVSIANFTGTIIGVSSAISAGSALTSVAVAAAPPVTSVRLSFNSNTSLGSTWRPAALQLSSPIILSADL